MVQSSLGLRLDGGMPNPLYRQIFDQVVDRVRTGALPAGFRLPPTRSLARVLGTHRNTVVRAYEDLHAAGFVQSTVGRGTFVARLPVPRSASQPAPSSPDSGKLPWSTLFASAALAEPLTRAERLGRGLRDGGDLINLARMQPSTDLLPDELLRRCLEHVLRTLGGRVLGYAAREGLPRLRDAIAADLARQGVPASADDLVVTSGSQQALDLIVRALVNPGEPFLVDEATYSGTLSAIGAAGARPIGVPSDDEGPSLEALERLGRTGAKGLYLMPNSHNPTGAVISPARRQALIAWSHRHGVPIIEDDYVADLDLDGRPPPAALRAHDGDVIYVGTYSKRLAPALRAGFIVCPAPLRPRLVALKHAVDLGNSDLLQHTLAEFLERGYLTAHLGRTLPEYRRRLDALEDTLRRHTGRNLVWRRPERGLALYIALPPGIDARGLFEESHRKGVLITPSMLNTVEDRPQGGVRLTYCHEPVPRIVEGARRFARALQAQGGHAPGEAVRLGGV